MNSKIFTPKFITISSLIIIAAVFRLIPHWPNFTPIAAMGIFGATHFSKKHFAFLIPLMALFLSDIILGFHNYMLSVYFSFALIVTISFVLKHNAKIQNIVAVSLISSTLFFVITNFAVWFNSPFYIQNFSGLMTCFIAGLPFYGYQTLGDLFYTGVLFGVFYLVSNKIPSFVKN